MSLTPGTPAPSFSLPDQEGNTHSLDQSRGQWLLLYFYPKDDTPGCTTEACGFRDLYAELQKRGVIVLGMSADSAESHEKFAEKFSLRFPLLSDPDKKTIQAYGAWGEKSMMGKKYMGILRTSYLIDPDGKIAKVYEKVKPEEHPQEVLKDVVMLREKQ